MKNRETGFPTHCVWCKKEDGTQEHMLWSCQGRPKKLMKPKDPLQARLGWPTGKKERKRQDLEVMEWFEEVVREAWRQRYGEGKEARAEAESQEVEDEEEEDEEETEGDASAQEEEDEKAEAEEDDEDEAGTARKKPRLTLGGGERGEATKRKAEEEQQQRKKKKRRSKN